VIGDVGEVEAVDGAPPVGVEDLGNHEPILAGARACPRTGLIGRATG
jgi:hypothetical protein